MRALLCESFGDLTGVRNHDDDPIPEEYDADGAIEKLLPHCSPLMLLRLEWTLVPAEMARRAAGRGCGDAAATPDPETPLFVAAADTDAQEGE